MGTTRRDILRFAGAASATALVAACTPRAKTPAPAGPAAAPASTDLIVVETATGLAVYDSRTGAAVIPAAPGVLSFDGRQLITVAGSGLAARDTRTGATLATIPVRGKLVPRVVSPGGRFIALTPPAAAGATPYRPAGRRRSTIVVTVDGAEKYRLDLPGNLEPEAFSADGKLLFVLDYLPPTAPDSYRVRSLELATGNLAPLFTRLKTPVPPGAEETMRGEGRQAVLDPSRFRLFTLYTHQPDHLHTRELVAGARAGKPDVHAFVHTLSLTEGWAFCVDLPAPFGESAAAGHTIAYNGSRVFVTAAGGGRIASIDAEQLTVGTVANLPVTSGAASSAVSPDAGRLLVAAGAGVRPIDLASLAPAGPVWRLDAEVRGIASGTRVVHVGQIDSVAILDPQTGLQRGRIAVPGLRQLLRALPA